MSTTGSSPRRGRRGGGREAKRARATASGPVAPYIKRNIPFVDIINEEGLELIERNADIILEEIGIDFRDDAEALDMWREAGADVQGERVRFPRGLCRKLITCLLYTSPSPRDKRQSRMPSSA